MRLVFMSLICLSLSSPTVLSPIPAQSASENAAAGIAGHWLDTGDASIVLIAPCGQTFCGRLVAFKGDQNARDALNPKGSLKDRPVCGLEVLSELSVQAENEWGGGRLYDPETGESYSATARLDEDRLNVRAFVGTEIFGETLVWSRVAAPAAPCTTSE